MCSTGDPLYIVKIVIGPIICFVLLLLVSVTGFVMFKKKYAVITLVLFIFLNCVGRHLEFIFVFPL